MRTPARLAILIDMIEARALTKRYATGRAAVDDLSFEVRPGIVTGFLGPNGAGKSTTMRMILGLDRPSRGSALVNGMPYERLREPLRQVGAVLEARSVHNSRSSHHHLLWLARTAGIGRRRVLQVLEEVGLADVGARSARGLSLGMGQRLGLAAALLGDPPILLLDEPINGLDPEGVRWMRTRMQGWAAEGRTVFVSSHLLGEMALTAQHLVVIARGRLLADCATAEFIDRNCPPVTRASTVDAGRLAGLLNSHGLAGRLTPEPGVVLVEGAPAAAVARIAAANGILLDELGALAPSLEDAFLRLTSDPHAAASARAAGVPA